ncbi:MAG: histone deacetylase [bacterium]
MQFIFSPEYEKPDIGPHIFPLQKYRLVKDMLVRNKIALEDEFLIPEKAQFSDILLVHTESYIKKLIDGKLSMRDQMQLELPYSRELGDAALYCVGGSIKAFEVAAYHNVGVHIGGGFHHAFPDHGEGFCVLNDVAVTIAKALSEEKSKRSLVVDCDLHQGNGTAYIFRDNPLVFTFSMHQGNIYPYPKENSTLDIELSTGMDDTIYNKLLDKNLINIIRDFKPDSIFYIAGADPFEGDQLSALHLSIEGLRNRDSIVIGHAKKNKLPVMISLAGGYAVNVENTVRIHYNTCLEAQKYYI